MTGRVTYCLILYFSLIGLPAAATLEPVSGSRVLRACLAPIDPALVRVAPEGCETDCEFTGLVVDQVRAFADSLIDIEVQLVEVGWAEQFENNHGVVDKPAAYTPRLLQDGSCDMYVSNLSVLPWRETKVAIVPLYQNRMIVMIRSKREADFPDLQALAGKTAIVEEQSSFHSWLLERNAELFYNHPVTIQLADETPPFDLVASGLFDFTITDADIAVFAMKNRHKGLTPTFAVGPIQQLGWGVSTDNTDLQTLITDFFQQQRADIDSPLNKAWRSHLGITINEFESLIQSLPTTER